MSRTREGDVAGDGDDASLPADVLEVAVGGPGEDLPAVAAEELHLVLGRARGRSHLVPAAAHRHRFLPANRSRRRVNPTEEQRET